MAGKIFDIDMATLAGKVLKMFNFSKYFLHLLTVWDMWKLRVRVMYISSHHLLCMGKFWILIFLIVR